MVPEPDADAFHARIPNATGPTADGIYVVPCDAVLALELVVGGVRFPVDRRDLVLQPPGADGGAGGRCASGVQSNRADAGGWILGDVFLKNVSATGGGGTGRHERAEADGLRMGLAGLFRDLDRRRLRHARPPRWADRQGRQAQARRQLGQPDPPSPALVSAAAVPELLYHYSVSVLRLLATPRTRCGISLLGEAWATCPRRLPWRVGCWQLC